MKRNWIILAIFLVCISVGLAHANPMNINIIAIHKGHDGLTPLSERKLFIQIPVEGAFYVKTDDKSVFELSSQYAKREIRAYLVAYNGAVLAGCFSDFVPVKLGKVTLRGIDCV